MKNVIKYCLVLLLAVVILFSGCEEKKKLKDNEAPEKKIEPVIAQTYDFTQAEKRDMKGKLKEISGIHYIKDESLAAIEDEDGRIFTVDFASGKILSEQVFAGAGDYEDITLDSGFFYVLESNGTIYKVSRNADSSKVLKYAFQNNGKIEFESMYLDASGENLILICKHCPGGKKSGIHAYSFNLQNLQFNDSPAFSLNMDALSKDENPSGLKPSAAAIHPIENKLYVLCSVGKTLLVCNQQGKVEKAYPLNPEVFQQPEGIAFSPNGDMFISNESNITKANILKIAYRSY